MSKQDHDELNNLVASAVLAAIKPAMRMAWVVLTSILVGTVAVVGYIERVDYNIRDAHKIATEARDGFHSIMPVVNNLEKKVAVIEERTSKKP